MSIIVSDFTAIGAAVLLAAVGGEAFLKAILSAATHLRVSRALIASTLAAFATSSPELTVSATAAIAGQPEIGLGDALGSNVVNIALVFGLALLLGPIATKPGDFGRDFRLALTAPALTLILCIDGSLDRLDAAVLLAAFTLWLTLSLRAGMKERAEGLPDTDDRPVLSPLPTLLIGLAGLGALIMAGHLFVAGAQGMAASWGLNTYVIGAIVVALGTSLPELVTVILARLRGHDDVGVGTLMGSNIFNGLAIVGMAGSIHPIVTPLASVAPTLVVGSLALLMLKPRAGGLIPPSRGLMLLGLYVSALLAMLGSLGRMP